MWVSRPSVNPNLSTSNCPSGPQVDLRCAVLACPNHRFMNKMTAAAVVKQIRHGGSEKWHVSLAGVAQWSELGLVDWKVAGSIPGQGTCQGCRPGPQVGVWERQPIDVSLSPFFSLFSPLSKKKKRKARWCASSMVTQQVVLLYHTAFQAQNFQWLNLVLFFQFYQAIIETSHCTSARYIT